MTLLKLGTVASAQTITEPQRVLLVGATSPIGRAVAKELAAVEHLVTGTSRSGGAGLEQLDVTDRLQCESVLARVRPDAVIYLARPELAQPDPAQPDREPNGIDSAVEDLRRFGEQCVEHGVSRLVFASSAAVYGTAANTPRAENCATPGNSPYAILKLRSEVTLAELASAAALSVITLRIFNAYGPGLVASLVNRLAAPDGLGPQVYHSEHFIRDYIHAADVARGFGAAIAANTNASAVLNLGTGVGTSNRELLALFPSADYRENPEFEGSSVSVAETSLIFSSLGFEPRITLPMAVANAQKFIL